MNAFALTRILAGIVVATFILLPVASVLISAVNVSPQVLLSLLTATLSILIIFAIGTPLAYHLARNDLAMVLPPTVVGRAGIAGNFLTSMGITLPFTTLAVVMAQTFVALPLYVRQTLPLAIYSALQVSVEKAMVLAALMVLISFFIQGNLGERGLRVLELNIVKHLSKFKLRVKLTPFAMEVLALRQSLVLLPLMRATYALVQISAGQKNTGMFGMVLSPISQVKKVHYSHWGDIEIEMRKIPLIPRGAASSAYGGVVPTNGGIVVDLSLMRRILGRRDW